MGQIQKTDFLKQVREESSSRHGTSEDKNNFTGVVQNDGFVRSQNPMYDQICLKESDKNWISETDERDDYEVLRSTEYGKKMLDLVTKKKYATPPGFGSYEKQIIRIACYASMNPCAEEESGEILLHIRSDDVPQSFYNYHCISLYRELRDNKFPVHWMSEDIVDSIKNTDLDKIRNIKLENIKWFVKSGTIMFPQCVSNNGKWVRSMSFTIDHLFSDSDKGHFSMFALSYNNANSDDEMESLQFFDMSKNIGEIIDNIGNDNTSEEQDEYFRELFKIFFVCLVILSSESQKYVTEEKIIKNAKCKRLGKKVSYYSPSWIGKDFKVKYQYDPSVDSSGKMIEPYLRRGHVKHQAYGKGLVFRKLIWIEPTMVCGYLKKNA